MEKIEITNLNIVGYYGYEPDIQIVNYSDESNKIKECVICKRSLLDTNYETISENFNILKENDIIIGKCGHMFHKECIDSWLINCNTCPIDNVKWHFHKIADSTTNLVLYKTFKNKNNLK